MTCPWCGSDKIKHDSHKTISAPIVAVELGAAKIPMMAVSVYSECECGLLFQENRQSDEWYNWYYESGTYRQTLGIGQEDMDRDEQARALDLVTWLKGFGIDINHHLDIGSSRGYFLQKTFATFDCLTTGIEPNTKYIQHEAGDVGNPDLVSAIHVLEHVTNPVTELTHYAELTTKYLLIEVPGMNTLGGALRFAHLYYFPSKLLRAKIESLGFRILGLEIDPNTRILAERE
jgi:hypothetical protein